MKKFATILVLVFMSSTVFASTQSTVCSAEGAIKVSFDQLDVNETNLPVKSIVSIENVDGTQLAQSILMNIEDASSELGANTFIISGTINTAGSSEGVYAQFILRRQSLGNQNYLLINPMGQFGLVNQLVCHSVN